MVQNLFILFLCHMTNLSPTSLHLIQTDAARTHLISTLEKEDVLCVDTEFHSENRYTPKLMLLQIADLRQNTWIVDPLQIDITPLAAILKKKPLILHGCTEDVRILQRRLFFTPTAIFDTQIAAALLGIYYPTSLNGIIKACFGIQDPQQQTLSDWSKRPLSEQQLSYAAYDVSCLGPLFLYFQDKLKHRQQQVQTICSEFVHNALHPNLEKEWLQWGVTKTLSQTAINILHELLLWREKQAQQQNKPSNYILPKRIAIDIAKRHPKTIPELRQNRRMNGVLIKKHGNALIQCVQKGEISGHQFQPLSTKEIRFADVLRSWAFAFSQSIDIDANLLLPQPLSLQIASDGPQILQGWRRDLLLEPLQEFISGKTHLYIDNQQLYVQ